MTWAKELQNNVTGAAGLREYRALSPEEEKRLETILHKYPMRATRYYLSLVNWDDYGKDPIYRLCVPTVLEEDSSGSLDTSGESTNTRLPGLQHKYRETVLVLTTHECAMYCRRCFRKGWWALRRQERRRQTQKPRRPIYVPIPKSATFFYREAILFYYPISPFQNILIC